MNEKRITTHFFTKKKVFLPVSQPQGLKRTAPHNRMIKKENRGRESVTNDCRMIETVTFVE